MKDIKLSLPQPVFEHLVGRYQRVREFEEYGCAWFFFRIRSDPVGQYHSVAIEPHLLRVKRTRGGSRRH